MDKQRFTPNAPRPKYGKRKRKVSTWKQCKRRKVKVEKCDSVECLVRRVDEVLSKKKLPLFLALSEFIDVDAVSGIVLDYLFVNPVSNPAKAWITDTKQFEPMHIQQLRRGNFAMPGSPRYCYEELAHIEEMLEFRAEHIDDPTVFRLYGSELPRDAYKHWPDTLIRRLGDLSLEVCGISPYTVPFIGHIDTVEESKKEEEENRGVIWLGESGSKWIRIAQVPEDRCTLNKMIGLPVTSSALGDSRDVRKILTQHNRLLSKEDWQRKCYKIGGVIPWDVFDHIATEYRSGFVALEWRFDSKKYYLIGEDGGWCHHIFWC